MVLVDLCIKKCFSCCIKLLFDCLDLPSLIHLQVPDVTCYTISEGEVVGGPLSANISLEAGETASAGCFHLSTCDKIRTIALIDKNIFPEMVSYVNYCVIKLSCVNELYFSMFFYCQCHISFHN